MLRSITGCKIRVEVDVGCASILWGLLEMVTAAAANEGRGVALIAVDTVFRRLQAKARPSKT